MSEVSHGTSDLQNPLGQMLPEERQTRSYWQGTMNEKEQVSKLKRNQLAYTCSSPKVKECTFCVNT